MYYITLRHFIQFEFLFIPFSCSFETEAHREIPISSEEIIVDGSERDGWINVRQVLSFELGSPPEFQPQMAYVLRVRRGKSQNLRDLPLATIEEWFEFCFRGADNTGMYMRFLRIVHLQTPPGTEFLTFF